MAEEKKHLANPKPVIRNADLQSIRRRIKILLWLFIVGLILSGLTAFPINAELAIFARLFGESTFMASWWPAMALWLSHAHRGVAEMSQRYPFMAYGTDWLAFAHIVIAVAFIGPLRDPVKNIWVVEFGMIACALVIPLALICGPIRGIPFFWRLIDCSFGVFGVIPLWFAWRNIRHLQPD